MSVRKKAPSKKTAPGAAECLCMGFGPELTRMVQDWGSDAAKGHFRNARIEMLKGLRALIDHRIGALSRRPRRGTTIEVD